MSAPTAAPPVLFPSSASNERATERRSVKARPRKTPGNRKAPSIAVVVTTAHEELIERLIEGGHYPSIAAVLRAGLIEVGKDALGAAAVAELFGETVAEAKEVAPLA